MIDINDLLYWGSVTISMNEEGQLVGNAMIELEKGYIPLELSSDNLSFLEFQPVIMQKLKEGNQLYMVAGNIYLGRPLNEGPYGENKTFVTEADAESLTILGLIKNLEYQVENNLGKKKKLVKFGELYRESSANKKQ